MNLEKRKVTSKELADYNKRRCEKGETEKEVIKFGTVANRVLVVREQTKDKKFLKVTFLTQMSIPMHFGMCIQSLIALLSNKLGNDSFQKDVLAYFYISGIYFDNQKNVLQVRIELSKQFEGSKYKIFERSGLFPLNVLEYSFLSHF